MLALARSKRFSAHFPIVDCCFHLLFEVSKAHDLRNAGHVCEHIIESLQRLHKPAEVWTVHLSTAGFPPADC